MELNDRQKKIFEYVQEKGRVSVTALAKQLYVSDMTIRRDLAAMEKSGMLKRYRGGAVSNIDESDMPLSHRLRLSSDEKRLLSAKAEKYLRNNITVYIDSSSTCLYLISYLSKYSGIRLITNSVKALMYAAKLHIPTILLGGNYFETDMCLVGSIAERLAAEINVDIAFFTTSGLSDDGLITDSDMEQTAVRRIIMKNAAQNIFLFEKAKLHRKYVCTLCRAEDATEIILSTD